SLKSPKAADQTSVATSFAAEAKPARHASAAKADGVAARTAAMTASRTGRLTGSRALHHLFGDVEVGPDVLHVVVVVEHLQQAQRRLSLILVELDVVLRDLSELGLGGGDVVLLQRLPHLLEVLGRGVD